MTAPDLAVLARAEPVVLEHLARLVADELDPVLHVLRGPGGRTYELTITGLHGDAVVVEHLVTLVPTDDLTRLVLLRLHVEQIVQKQRRWKKSMNPKLSGLGLKSIS